MTPWTRVNAGIDIPRAPSAHARSSRGQEHRSEQIVPLHELVRGPVEADLAALYEETALGQAHGPVDTLLDQYDGRALGIHMANDSHQSIYRQRSQSQAQLVNHQEQWLGHHHPGQGELLL